MRNSVGTYTHRKKGEREKLDCYTSQNQNLGHLLGEVLELKCKDFPILVQMFVSPAQTLAQTDSSCRLLREGHDLRQEHPSETAGLSKGLSAGFCFLTILSFSKAESGQLVFSLLQLILILVILFLDVLFSTSLIYVIIIIFFLPSQFFKFIQFSSWPTL